MNEDIYEIAKKLVKQVKGLIIEAYRPGAAEM